MHRLTPTRSLCALTLAALAGTVGTITVSGLANGAGDSASSPSRSDKSVSPDGLSTSSTANDAPRTPRRYLGVSIAPQARMGDPVHGLTPAELDRFNTGFFAYTKNFSAEEGLGPVFNKESCGNCHNNPIGGTGGQTVTRFGQAGKGTFDPLDSLGGSLLQAQTISLECQETMPPQANRMSLRLTNGSMGYGLIEAIPDADLKANETTPPSPDVSGRAHMVGELETPGSEGTRVGRFGWKAQLATILSFSGDASQNEIGFSNRLVPFDNDPNGILPPALEDCDAVDDPEDFADEEGYDFIDRVTDFQRFLTQPPQTPRSGMSGEVIFANVGCADCHTPSFTTSSDISLENALRGKSIRPYSDFLLHDMGTAADFIPQGDASEREIRTPVLWGVRGRDPMWHDGRIGGGTFAERMELVIMEHDAFGSEGTTSAQAYAALSSGEKAQLIQFLDSLGRAEFDHDGDNDVELDDFVVFKNCYFGSGPYSADDACAISDIDQDGTVGPNDYGSFLLAFDGPVEDCNENGVPDTTDVIDGTSDDLDDDGRPDECACFGDLTGDGTVGFADLTKLLSAWGPCPGCPEDLTGDGSVGFADLTGLLNAWGPCS